VCVCVLYLRFLHIIKFNSLSSRGQVICPRVTSDVHGLQIYEVLFV